MSTYGYGPPPPPPPASTASGGPTYGHPSGPYTHHGQSRGGGGGGGGGGGASSRGRNAHYHGGRGDYQNSQPRYEYPSQPYPAHNPNPVPYGSSHPPASSYPHQPSWAPEHGHAPPHHAHPHAPAPISASNYHPNYAPQPYPAPQYPSQPPPYAPQPVYGNSYPGPPPPPPPPAAPLSQAPWNGQGAPHQPSYGGGGRSRGGYGDRGGHNKSAATSRRKFEHDAAPAPPPVPISNSYGQPFPHDPRAAAPYPPPSYPYAGAPPPPPVPTTHSNSYHGQYPRRGRGGGGGGGHRDGSARGRGGHHDNHRSGDKSRFQKQQQQQQQHQQAQQQKHQQPQQPGASQTPSAKQESPSAGKKKKRKTTNTLGLTPGAAESEPEEDGQEGIEDEKVLAELLGQETPAIDDIAQYLEQRRNNFPTKARIEAKKAAELAQDKEDKAASLEREADRLRRQLRKVEFSIKRKREQGDEGDEMRDPSEEPSDDEKPEVMTSRSQGPTDPSSALSLSGKKADISRHCKYYSTGGTCGKKGKCRFVHDPAVREAALKEREANNGRLTIQQRLILNDKEQDDLAVLQSIQYLRDKGLMTSGPAPDAKTLGEQEARKEDTKKTHVPQQQQQQQPASTLASLPVPKSIPPPPPRAATSTLPAASPSLPPPPIRREPGIPPPRRTNPPPSIIPNANSVSTQGIKHYESWLLQPYGSPGGKQAPQ